MTLLEMNGVLDNFNIRIGKTINAYSDAASALAGINPSSIPVAAQDAIAYGAGGFEAWNEYWPAIPIRYNLPGETGYWQWSWINTNENIPLATPTTVTSSNFAINDAAMTLPITLTPQSPNVTHDVVLRAYARHLGDWLTIKTWSNVAASQAWTITQAEAQSILTAFRTAAADTVSVTVHTKSNGVVVGSRSVSVQATVHSSIAPVFTAAQMKEVSAEIIALQLEGATAPDSRTYFVQTYSKPQLRLVGGSRPGYASHRKRLLVKLGDTTIHDIVFDPGDTGTTTDETYMILPVTRPGTFTLTVTLTDTRDRTKTASQPVTVLTYRLPALSSVQVRRASDTSGTLNEAGTYVRIDARTTFSKLMVGSTAKNVAKLIVHYRQVGTTDWTVLGEITLTSETQTVSHTFPTQVGQNTTYDVRVTVSDKLHQAGTTLLLATQKVPLSIGKDKGIGVGKIWEAGALDIASSGGVAIDGVLKSPWPWLMNMGAIAPGTDFDNLQDGYYLWSGQGETPNGPPYGGIVMQVTAGNPLAPRKSQAVFGQDTICVRHFTTSWLPWTMLMNEDLRIGQLQSRVQTLETNASLSMSPLTGTHFQYVVLYRIGKVTHVMGGMSITQAVSAGANTVVGSIPAGYRPRNYIEIMRPVGSITPNPVRLRFTQAGEIQLYVYGSSALPVGSVIDCNIAYMVPDT